MSIINCELFIIACVNAFFTTAVNFLFINDKLDFWNIVMHLSNSLLIMVELCINTIPVMWRDCAISISWPMLYLCVLWPLVRYENVEWPYEFLRTDTLLCFVWYPGLLVSNLGIFFFVWGIAALRDWGVDYSAGGTARSRYRDASLSDEHECELQNLNSDPNSAV
mmetsp:Transcript_18142/g.26617  ORF Transcript_18142/g.26617 Transcript_18142/m.26617 type:complete len:165 (-) Transcript_18142:109-603(-)